MTGRNNRRKVREHQLYTVKPEVWRHLKKENAIEHPYRMRAWRISMLSRIFLPAFCLQSALYRQKIEGISFENSSPLFILGLWRSGTTHLHYMLAKDTRFAFLNNHQAFTLNMSLLSFKKLNKLLDVFVPGKRPQDDVTLTLDDPAEEEQPFSTMTHRSSIHSFYFPNNQDYFRKYHLFQDIGSKEREAWKDDYLLLLKNIALYNGNTNLLLKNPHNTGRVPELLELFPRARFIFLHRDPGILFHSTRRLYNKMIRTQFLQQFPNEAIDRVILENNAAIMKRYLETRSLIPAGQMVELGFEDLNRDPLGSLRHIYNSLDMEGYDKALPGIQKYLYSVKDYRLNRYPDISGDLRQKIKESWGFWAEAYQYPITAS